MSDEIPPYLQKLYPFGGLLGKQIQALLEENNIRRTTMKWEKTKDYLDITVYRSDNGKFEIRRLGPKWSIDRFDVERGKMYSFAVGYDSLAQAKNVAEEIQAEIDEYQALWGKVK